VALFYALAPDGTDGATYNVNFTALQVLGALAPIGTGPYSLLGSDIIKHTAARAAPMLDTSNVMATTHGIDQFAVMDVTHPYDLWLLANQYERWYLAVWEDRKLHYSPPPDTSDTATPTWVLRTSDRGVRTGYDGPTTDGQANGIKVRFQNVYDGASTIIDPTTNPELADTDTRLAANQAGRRVWQAITLPNPNSPAGAAKIGVAALAEFNRRRTPGRFTIQGHIHDAARNLQQGWRVRAGDTLLVQDAEDAPVRTVHEASWSQDGHTLTLNADASATTIDAILDKILNG